MCIYVMNYKYQYERLHTLEKVIGSFSTVLHACFFIKNDTQLLTNGKMYNDNDDRR